MAVTTENDWLVGRLPDEVHPPPNPSGDVSPVLKGKQVYGSCAKAQKCNEHRTMVARQGSIPVYNSPGTFKTTGLGAFPRNDMMNRNRRQGPYFCS